MEAKKGNEMNNVSPLNEVKHIYTQYLEHENASKSERENLVQAIKRARQERYTLQAIADVLGLSPQAIYQITKEK